MPLNQNNVNFTNNPLQFMLINRVINNQNTDSAVFGKCFHADNADKEAASKALAAIDAAHATIDIDFMSYAVGNYRGILPRIVIKPYLDQLIPGNAMNLVAARNRLNAQGKLPADPANVVRGYYFPYKYGKIRTLADVGYCDLPKQNPTYKLCFTGAMNGCAIVVTTPPGNANVLRVYHYQNESDNPDFVAANYTFPGTTKTGKGKGLIPGTIHYWFHAAAYAGNGDEEVAGFNLLHYNQNNRWQILSLPLRQLAPDPNNQAAGVPMAASSKAPFAQTFNY